MKIALPLLLMALALPVYSAETQPPMRVRGIISAFDGNALSVKAQDGKNVDVQLSEKTNIVFTQPITLSEIKPGDFLGVTSAKRSDGSLTAFEVRRFPKPVNPGHRPYDDRDDQTMTNATVATTVQAKSGREMTLSYEGGSQKIVVPENAAISMLVPGERAQLLPGAAVSLTAMKGADGTLTAQNVQVGKPVKAPQ
jgi:hypothetical protein